MEQFRIHLLHRWLVVEGGNPFYPYADAYCDICGKVRWRRGKKHRPKR
jgi:hypothetical protein